MYIFPDIESAISGMLAPLSEEWYLKAVTWMLVAMLYQTEKVKDRELYVTFLFFLNLVHFT